MRDIKQVAEEVLLAFYGVGAVSRIFLSIIVNFKIGLPWDNIFSYNRWQRFVFEIYFEIPLIKISNYIPVLIIQTNYIINFSTFTGV